MSADAIQIMCFVWGLMLFVLGEDGNPWLAASLVIAALQGGAA